jgi:hypothetical protein
MAKKKTQGNPGFAALGAMVEVVEQAQVAAHILRHSQLSA